MKTSTENLESHVLSKVELISLMEKIPIDFCLSFNLKHVHVLSWLEFFL